MGTLGRNGSTWYKSGGKKPLGLLLLLLLLLLYYYYHYYHYYHHHFVEMLGLTGLITTLKNFKNASYYVD